MSDQQYILVPMTLEGFYERKRLAKEERSRRLARLPIAKKMEMVEKFRDIENEALRWNAERRAADDSGTDKD